MNTHNAFLALVSGLAIALVSVASAKAETVDVVASTSTSCVATYVNLVAEDGTEHGTVTLTCPHQPEQVAAVAHS
jgi:hypothetical protein